MHRLLLTTVVLFACSPDPEPIEPFASETGTSDPDSGQSLHGFMMDNLTKPTGHVTVTGRGAEGALVAKTPVGRRAAVDLSMDRADGSIHAELWIAGERVHVLDQGELGELEPGEEHVFAAAVVALARRFAANDCPDCCAQAMHAARVLAPEVSVLSACHGAEASCCD